VFAGGANKTDIVVQRVGKAPDTPLPISPVGRWLAEDIRSGGVIDRLQTVLEIAADGTVSGSGGCNAMRGKATISGETIVFGPIAVTNKTRSENSSLLSRMSGAGASIRSGGSSTCLMQKASRS
jgi:heat shock protein HslJ